jgi:hypothetical protein
LLESFENENYILIFIFIIFFSWVRIIRQRHIYIYIFIINICQPVPIARAIVQEANNFYRALGKNTNWYVLAPTGSQQYCRCRLLGKKYELQLYGKPTIFTEDSVKIFGMISDLCWQGSQQFYVYTNWQVPIQGPSKPTIFTEYSVSIRSSWHDGTYAKPTIFTEHSIKINVSTYLWESNKLSLHF